MYTIGQIAGSVYAGQIADRFGRRAGMGTGAFIILIGTATIASAAARGGRSTPVQPTFI